MFVLSEGIVCCLGRIVGLFLLILLIVLIPTTVWSIAFWQVGTRPETYTETFDAQVYERLAPLVLPGLLDAIHDDTESRDLKIALDLIQKIDAETWEEESLAVVSPEWLQTEVGRNATEALDYFNGNRDTFNIVFDFGPVVDHLEGPEGQQLVDQVMEDVRDWSACNASQNRDLTNYLTGRTGSLPRCEPSPALRDTLEDHLRTGLSEISEWLPENGLFVLRDETINRFGYDATEYDTTVTDTRSMFIMLNRTTLAAVLMPLMLLGLIVLFAVRSAKEFFLWSGLALVIGGFLTILPIFPWLYGLTRPIQQASDDSVAASLGAEATGEIARALAGAITTPVLGITAVMILSGFVLVVVAAVMRDPESPLTQYFYMPSDSTPGGTPTPAPAYTPPPSQSPESSAPMRPVQEAVEELPDDRTTITPPDSRRSEAKTASLSPQGGSRQEDIHTVVDHAASVWDKEMPHNAEDAPTEDDTDEKI